MRKKDRREYLETGFSDEEREESLSDYFLLEDNDYWDDEEELGFPDENERRIAPHMFNGEEEPETDWDARDSKRKKRRLVVCASLVGLLAVVALFLGIGSATNLVGDAANAHGQSAQSQEGNNTQDSPQTPPDSNADNSNAGEEEANQNSEPQDSSAGQNDGFMEQGPANQDEGEFSPQLSSSEGQDDTANSVPDSKSITVHVQVDSSRAASKGWPFSMASTKVNLKSGDSVYDALCAAGVSVDGSSEYVKSINGLAEFDCGRGSGWLYSVNGKLPSYSCGSYKLKGNEIIRWIYTLDMGKDV